MTISEGPVGVGPEKLLPDQCPPLRRMALAIRHSLLGLRTCYFRSLDLQTEPDTQISLKAKVDLTSPRPHGTLTAPEKSSWSPRVPWLWSNAVSITGEQLGPFVMGRKVDGQWEYRNMTSAEAREWQDVVQGY
jgi:hypothetical protein